MLIDDLIDILRIDIGVPGTLRVNHQNRSLFTAIQATGLVDANVAGTIQAHLLDALFGMFLRDFRAPVGATRTTIVALVDANENVVLII